MRLFPIVVLALIALAAACFGGCGDAYEFEGDVGELGVSLLTESDSGVVYRLRNALFLVRGPEDVDVCTEDYDINEPLLLVPLESGDYQVTLNDGAGGAGGSAGTGGTAGGGGTAGNGGTGGTGGSTCDGTWFMEYSANGRPFAPIEAQLVSANPAEVTITTQQTTLVTFSFEVDGRLINFGPGTLAIDIDVTEVFGVGGAGGDGGTGGVGGVSGAGGTGGDGGMSGAGGAGGA
jgi:uncharacterized membrane protein YgcG